MTVGVKIDLLLLLINIDRGKKKDKRVESRGGVAIAELVGLQDNWVLMEKQFEVASHP